MARRALIEHRPWLLAAILCAVAYLFLRSGSINEWPIVLLKGAAVAALAIYAWRRGRGVDAALLAVILILSAVGDMGMEKNLTLGGGAFVLSYTFAIVLYRRSARSQTTGSQKAAAIALLLISPLLAWSLTQEIVTTIYAISLGAMASAAWLSRFSRYRVGVGVILLVIANGLIFWNIADIDAQSVPSLSIWPLYFIGQFMIATGVVQHLTGEANSTK